LLKSCFPGENQPNVTQNGELKLEDLLNGALLDTIPITVTPVSSPPSLLLVFPNGAARQTLRISVLENGDLDFDVDESLKTRVAGLLEGAGIGVCIEMLRKVTAYGR